MARMRKMAQRLDPQLANRLLNLSEEIARRVDAGEDPNAAIARVVKQASLPKGALSLLVNAYNRGMFSRNFSSGSDWEEKVAAYPVAHLKKVEALLYPEKIPTPGQQKAASTVSDVYSRPPVDNNRPLPLTKTASAVRLPSAHTRPKYASEYGAGKLRAQLREQCRFQQRMQQLRKEAQAGLDIAFDRVLKLADHLARPGAPSLDLVRQQAEAAFGRRGELVVQWLDRTMPDLRQIQKRARDYGPADPEVFGLLSEIMDALDKHAAANQEYEQLARQYEEKYGRCELPKKRLKRVGYIELDEEEEESVKLKEAFNLATVGSLASAAAAVQSAKNTSELIRQKREKELAKMLSSVPYLTQSSMVASMNTIMDMMMNDPIISKQDPEEVIRLINELGATNWKILAQPIALRQALRQWFAGTGEIPLDRVAPINVEQAVVVDGEDDKSSGKAK